MYDIRLVGSFDFGRHVIQNPDLYAGGGLDFVPVRVADHNVEKACRCYCGAVAVAECSVGGIQIRCIFRRVLRNLTDFQVCAFRNLRVCAVAQGDGEVAALEAQESGLILDLLFFFVMESHGDGLRAFTEVKMLPSLSCIFIGSIDGQFLIFFNNILYIIEGNFCTILIFIGRLSEGLPFLLSRFAERIQVDRRLADLDLRAVDEDF